MVRIRGEQLMIIAIVVILKITYIFINFGSVLLKVIILISDSNLTCDVKTVSILLF